MLHRIERILRWDNGYSARDGAGVGYRNGMKGWRKEGWEREGKEEEGGREEGRGGRERGREGEAGEEPRLSHPRSQPCRVSQAQLPP